MRAKSSVSGKSTVHGFIREKKAPRVHWETLESVTNCFSLTAELLEQQKGFRRRWIRFTFEKKTDSWRKPEKIRAKKVGLCNKGKLVTSENSVQVEPETDWRGLESKCRNTTLSKASSSALCLQGNRPKIHLA